MRLLEWPDTAKGLRADLIALLAGAIAALAFPPLFFLPVLLVSFPTLLAQIGAAERPVVALRRGWWFGFGLHLVGLYWITEAILVEAARFWWLVPIAVPALAAVLAVFIAVPAMLARQAPAGWRRVLTLAGAWVLADLARQFLATGFPWNPIGSVWTMPGYAGDVMIQPAAWVSVHGMTLATVILACAPMLRARGRVLCLALLAGWIGAGIIRMRAPAPPNQPVRVILVQGNVPQGQKWNPTFARRVFDRYLRLTAAGVTTDPKPGTHTVIVWPETASPYLLGSDTAARDAIAVAAGGPAGTNGGGTIVLAGAVRFDPLDRPRNSLFAIDENGDIDGVYDKWHLVPFGEYQPGWMPIGIQVVPGGGFARGPGPRTLHLPGLPPVGPLICYEAIFPGQVIDERDRPTWMVNVTNDAWFGTSSGPRQHLAAARLRAVEEGLPLMRAANTGITAAFDSRGHEITRLGLDRTGVREVVLPGALPPTPFARFGLMIPATLALLAFLAGRFAGSPRRTG
jgi:apolipoprotein N-acyltransferase